MNILGINISHDASLALVRSGRLVGATSIERYSRIKKDSNIRREHIDRFLADFGLELTDIDTIALSFYIRGCIPFMSLYSPEDQVYPFCTYGSHREDTKILSILKPTLIEGKGYTIADFVTRLRPPYSGDTISGTFSFKVNVKFDGVDKLFDGYLVDHQAAHAASVFYTSKFDRSMVFTADASMHDATACSMWWYGFDNFVQPFRCPGYMMGNFYDVATEFCGIGPGTFKAGSLMGLSSYGRVSEKTIANWKEWTKPYGEREEKEDHIYCDWLFSQISGKFPTIGTAIPEIVNELGYHESYTRRFQQVFSKEESDKGECMNVAASIQYITERSLVKYTQQLYDESEEFNEGNLCLSGGLFLNCNANYKILKETPFENLHIFPACGDDGVSVGAALYVYHHIFENRRESYDNSELMYTGSRQKFRPIQPHQYDFLCREISQGKIVCWHQGRSEFGPRALGHRSFIADARNEKMKDTLNHRVKFREWYRPFAPAVLVEDAHEWFDLEIPSPFMLYTVPCKKPKQIPSAVHVDNTSRVQTVDRKDNPEFYDLIHHFKKLTGVPVLLNTSLNIKGEPIVETEEDSIKLFKESDADILVLNGKIVEKKPPSRPFLN